jgi:putative ABC transport system substrate-binding protein
MSAKLKRREFISLLGGAAAWPLAARAQQGERMRRIGVLIAWDENDPAARTYLSAFTQVLAELGWIDGHNLTIDYRWAAGHFERLPLMASELVAAKLELIVASATAALAAAQQTSGAIPIVFNLVTDPVAQGFVASLARPGGNITGFSHWESAMGGKWLELLKETAPEVKRRWYSTRRRHPISDCSCRRWRLLPAPSQ